MHNENDPSSASSFGMSSKGETGEMVAEAPNLKQVSLILDIPSKKCLRVSRQLWYEGDFHFEPALPQSLRPALPSHDLPPRDSPNRRPRIPNNAHPTSPAPLLQLFPNPLRRYASNPKALPLAQIKVTRRDEADKIFLVRNDGVVCLSRFGNSCCTWRGNGRVCLTAGVGEIPVCERQVDILLRRAGSLGGVGGGRGLEEPLGLKGGVGGWEAVEPGATAGDAAMEEGESDGDERVRWRW